MKKKYYILFWMYSLLLSTACFAQDNGAMGEKPGMASGMRADGKIYVVVAVVVTILLGLFIYLASLDKKITRLEKDMSQGNGR